MRYYALYNGRVLIGVGTNCGGVEITEVEYNELLAEIRAKADLENKLYDGEITLDDVPAEWREEIQRRVDQRKSAETENELPEDTPLSE